jgi:hypothetical protein
MIRFSRDVDILKYEPVLFGELHLSWQVLGRGTGATLSGTTLTANDAGFLAAGVEAGGVVYLRSADGTLEGAYEIVSVDSATELTISVLRSDTADSPIAPVPSSDTSYRVSTFAPQAAEAAYQLTEHFGIQPGEPASVITPEDIMDAEVLRRASVFAVISGIYAMWAGRDSSDSFWAKSLHYKGLFEKARQRCRLSIDLGTDGVADITRIGGAVRLMRG